MSSGSISLPSRAHSRPDIVEHEVDEYEQEQGTSTGIELHELSSASNRVQAEQSQLRQRSGIPPPAVSLTSSHKSKSRFLRFWRAHVSIRVPMAKRRDHLALERTYLAYLRTSLALSMAGTTIAQLLRFTDPIYALGLYAGCVFGSMIIVLMGAIRFWRQQVAMAEHGKVWASGFEMYVIFIVCVALTVAVFVINVILTDSDSDDG